MRNKESAFACFAAIKAAHEAICALGIGDIDAAYRQAALNDINDAQNHIAEGVRQRDEEDRRDEEARVIKAWREGRVTIAGKVTA